MNNLTAVALAFAAQVAPWENYPNIAFSWDTTLGAHIWIEKAEIEPYKGYVYQPDAVIAWVHADYSRVKMTKARSSLQRVVYTCQGTSRIVARTLYAANGTIISEWDGMGADTAIRPGSMDALIEKALCPKK